jgi:hypothetical protein
MWFDHGAREEATRACRKALRAGLRYPQEIVPKNDRFNHADFIR